MLSGLTCFQEVYIACGKTDLRKGIDGLAMIVKEQFRLDPFRKDVLFLFCGGKQDRSKGLVWDGDGFLLLYKRIEAGRIQWPRDRSEVALLSPEDYRMLMEGFAILQRSTIREPQCSRIA
jgi:transposase